METIKDFATFSVVSIIATLAIFLMLFLGNATAQFIFG